MGLKSKWGADDIRITKLWQDQNVIAIRMECTGARASASVHVYVQEEQLLDLSLAIRRMLQGTARRAVWRSGLKWTDVADYVHLTFGQPCKRADFDADSVCVEVFMGFRDGVAAYRHHACFYVRTDRKNLRQFAKRIPDITGRNAGFCICLSDLNAHAPSGTSGVKGRTANGNPG